MVIDQAFAVPNPNPDRITFHLQGSVDDVLARVYTKALVCLGQAHAGPKAAGWAELSLQGRAFFKANGLYYVTLTPARGQASGKRVLLRMVELR
ncbi:MAG TPA: hypothetical protein VK786_03285 [bacterium]|nr:hypothetical protein [bacterium]